MRWLNSFCVVLAVSALLLSLNAAANESTKKDETKEQALLEAIDHGGRGRECRASERLHAAFLRGREQEAGESPGTARPHPRLDGRLVDLDGDLISLRRWHLVRGQGRYIRNAVALRCINRVMIVELD